MPTDNEIVAGRWTDDFWTKGNQEVADEILDPGFKDHDPNMPGLDGIDGHKNKHVAYRTAIPDLVLTAERMIPSGDDVVVQWRATGTHQGEVMGIAPTGNKIDFGGISILTVKNGKITKQVIQYDFLSFLAQVGAVTDPRA